MHKRNIWFGSFVAICVAIGLLFFIEKSIFGISGESLTFTVRRLLFSGIIFKQVSWFDSEHRAPGVLTTVLSEDVSCLNGMTTETLAVVMEAFLGMGLGVMLSCLFCWQMALMTIGCVPIMVVGVIAMSKL